MFLRSVFTVLFCWLLSLPAWAQLTTKIQPNPVTYGNPVTLTISSDQPFTAGPNLSVLEKNFILGGQQQRQSSQWINGVGKTQYELIYTLFPNTVGKIVVPELTLGTQKTSETTLVVVDKSSQGGKTPIAQDELELRVVCDNTQVYPSQPLACTAELIDPIGVVEGHIIPPESSEYTWQPTDNATKSLINYNGKDANLWTQSFIFTTTASGNIKIPAFMFQGKVLVDTTPASARVINHWTDMMFMGMGTATRTVTTLSKPFSLTILDKPADWKGWWLPSQEVTLTESYQMPQKIHVGESIERTVVLVAKDIDATALPVPTLAATPNIKVYTGLENRQDTTKGGQVSTTFTIVPIRAGEVVIPAITIPWFDTKNRVTRTAVVPERTIFVEKGNVEPMASAAQPAQPSAPTPPPTITTTQNQAPTIPPKTDWMFWLILAGVIGISFALGILGTLYFVKRKFKADNKKTEKKKKPLPDLYPF